MAAEVDEVTLNYFLPSIRPSVKKVYLCCGSLWEAMTVKGLVHASQSTEFSLPSYIKLENTPVPLLSERPWMCSMLRG